MGIIWIKTLAKTKKILAVAMMAVMGTALFPAAADAKESGIDFAKKGTASVQFYLKGAACYITDGTNLQQVGSFGTNGEGLCSSGSGFFVGSSGEDPAYIVTNCHVVDDYIQAGEGGTYLIPTGQTYQGYPVIIGAASCELRIYYDDNDYDVAYVDCSGDVGKVDLAVLRLGNATAKRHALPIQVPTSDMVGETVYTVGFPGNAENAFTGASKYGIDDITVHKGSITKFATNEGKGVERIQIDAVIQHGNSGGPLITENGYVIGVNTNVWSESPYAEQVEADYYSINASELVRFLDKNDIPYTLAASGSSFPTGIVAIVCIAAAGTGTMMVLKKKNAVPEQKASSPAAKNGKGKAPQRAFIRSMAAQHNGMALVVGSEPLMIGRDPAACKLVYAQGTTGVSGKHCTISYDAATGEFILTDLRSSYGTFLMNGQKLNANAPFRLKPGDSFYVGDKANTVRAELG